MKSAYLALFVFLTVNIFAQERLAKPEYVLVIHGGAGSIKKMPEDLEKAYRKSLENVLQLGEEKLKSGASAIDVVEFVVRLLEDDSLFNAGKGSTVNSEGIVEMDASIMDGSNLMAGAVSSVKRVKNPVSLARKIMDESGCVLLTSDGAEQFAKKMGLELVDPQYFLIDKVKNQWLNEMEKEKKGTVGAVALDKQGNLAAATSTGGLFMKLPGRVGDVPVIGAGNYADNNSCAVSCTGKGELFIRYSVASRIANLVSMKNYAVMDAANEVIHNLLPENSGGVIVLDRNGNYSMEFNTSGMFRGAITSHGKIEVLIWNY